MTGFVHRPPVAAAEPRKDWRAYRACTKNPERWELISPRLNAGNRAALAACRNTCPIREMCYKKAVEENTIGMIRGGEVFPTSRVRYATKGGYAIRNTELGLPGKIYPPGARASKKAGVAPSGAGQAS